MTDDQFKSLCYLYIQSDFLLSFPKASRVYSGDGIDAFKPTLIWYSRKGIWRRGPDISHNDDFCVSSVNSTSVVFIGVHSGAQMGVDVAGSRKNTSVFHLNLNKWTELADIDLGQNYDFEKCAATTIFSKESGKSQIYAIICKCWILKFASI